jgi:hypothetical protein
VAACGRVVVLFSVYARSGAHENKIQYNLASPLSYLLCKRKVTVHGSFWRVYSFFAQAHLPTYIFTIHMVYYLLSTLLRFLSSYPFFNFSLWPSTDIYILDVKEPKRPTPRNS